MFLAAVVSTFETALGVFTEKRITKDVLQFSRETKTMENYIVCRAEFS